MASARKVLELTAQSIFRQVDGAAKIMLAKSADSLEHLKSARIFFERGMVREAAAKASASGVAQLRELLAAQRHSARQCGSVHFSRHAAFTRRSPHISGNPIFTAVSEAMLGWLKEYHADMLIWAGKETFTLAEHEEIISCIEAGDADAAEDAMVKHLERARGLYAIGQARER